MRRVGLNGILSNRENQERLEQLSAELEEEGRQECLRVLNEFRDSFESFLSRHRRLIDSDPEFRLEFLELLNLLSVDPLSPRSSRRFTLFTTSTPSAEPSSPTSQTTASSSSTPVRQLSLSETSGPSFPGRLPRFTAEICTLVVEICSSTKHENGGICELGCLLSMMPPTYNLTEPELLRVVNELKVFGFEIVEINSRHYILSDLELTETQQRCLWLSSELRRGINCSDLSDKFGLSHHQAQIILWELGRLGLVWIDSPNTSGGVDDTYYWFPSLINTY